MIERLYTPCPCTWDEQPGWEFVESDSDYWRPCTDCNGTLKIKESDADHIIRLNKIIDWLAGACGVYHISRYGPTETAARLKAAKKAVEGEEG
jgi:hypothetical protein